MTGLHDLGDACAEAVGDEHHGVKAELHAQSLDIVSHGHESEIGKHHALVAQVFKSLLQPCLQCVGTCASEAGYRRFQRFPEKP